MRIFVVGTGRCGTRTFAQACKHVRNYTSGHETHAQKFIGNLSYPDGHIEVDHHLAWALPLLREQYGAGPDAFYVHLLRNRAECVASLSRRHDMDMWAALGCFVLCNRSTPERRAQAAAYYYDSKNAIIDATLGKQSLGRGFVLSGNCLTTYIESLPEAWPVFWDAIGAQGDYDDSLAECSKRYNRGLESKGEKVRDEH